MSATLNPLYVDYLGGDHLAALMLSQIVYWYRPGKDGRAKINLFKYDKYWLAKSHKDWFEELRLTRYQTQRCLEKLKSLGLIATEIFKFNGCPTVHIRLVGVQGNTLSNEWEPAMDCSKTRNGLHADAQSLTKTTAETTAEIKTGAAFGLASSASWDNPETLQGRTTPEAVKEKEMATIAEILSKTKTETKAKVPVGKSGMSFLWKKRMAELMDGKFQKALTDKEKGQLAQVYAKVGPERAIEVLDYALQHWTEFRWAVRDKKGVPLTPEIPVPGFVLSHFEILVQLIAQNEKREKAAIHAAVSKPQPKPQPKVVEKVDMPTPEDVLATLAMLKKAKGGS